jgi:coproporphyrinogen III oxidase-like Fe-S oxidoreductase
MMGLRLADGIPSQAFARRFGRDFDEVFPGLWAGWVERGLAAARDDGLRLLEQGRLVLDSLLQQVAERTAAEDLPPLTLTWQ